MKINKNLELEEVLCYTCIYNESKNLSYYFDNIQNIEYCYSYDLIGNLTKLAIQKDQNTDTIEYIYDAYGNIVNEEELSIFAYENPFRYKGYYHDKESNLYYCQTRYYSPEICRWISIDKIEYLTTNSIIGLNLYAYCNNNPIMYMDFEGTLGIKALLTLIALVVLAVVAVVAAITTFVAAKGRATDGAKCIDDDDEINLFMNPDEQTAGKEIYRFNYGGENEYIAE